MYLKYFGNQFKTVDTYREALLYLEFLYFLVLTLEKRELLSNISSILSVPAIDDWTL